MQTTATGQVRFTRRTYTDAGQEPLRIYGARLGSPETPEHYLSATVVREGRATWTLSFFGFDAGEPTLEVTVSTLGAARAMVTRVFTAGIDTTTMDAATLRALIT